ncbi:MAG TPA: VOC family protein [Dehalococcoidia bacterium]|nr:VOC family protein [Dehalococcoidia bacterium]
MAAKPIPDGYHSATPYLMVQGAAGLVDFLKRAFGAEETECLSAPDGTVMHAEVRIGDSIIMIGEAHGEFRVMLSAVHLYVNDADAMYQRALQAGATSVEEPKDQFWGDHLGGGKDAFGNLCWVSTHVEDVSPEELKERPEAFMKQMSGS